MKLFEESGFDTKVDLGDTDSAVVGREKWREDKPTEKPSGWVNPLSIMDDGTDDDQILDMNFKPLDEPYRKFIMPKYRYDEDIDDSMASLSSAEKMIGKEFEIMKKKAKDEVAKEEENAKKEAKEAKEAKSKEKKKDATEKKADAAEKK